MMDPEYQTAPTNIDHNEQAVKDRIIYKNPVIAGGGPPCIWDNAPTQKTGSCYTCIACGSTTSCG